MNRFRFLLSLMLVLALVGGVGLLYRGAAARQALPAGTALSTARPLMSSASALQTAPSLEALRHARSLNIGIITPTLGNYPTTTINLSANAVVTPDAAPTNTTSINVSTSTNFKGTFAANPTTGVVSVTDAHPAGTYTVTVTAFGAGGMTSKTFTLTVQTGTPCSTSILFTSTANVGVDFNPFSVAIGDFNNDGKQDIATANSRRPGTVSIRLGDGLGGFSGSTNVTVGAADTRSIAIGDFNNDGNQDFAAGNSNSHTVSIRLGDGLGGFSGSTEVSIVSPSSVAIGDFNNDGNQDFAAGNLFSNTVSIRLGDGLGGFSGATNVGVGSDPYSVAIGDFNNDGNQDFAAANGGVGDNTVSIRLGDGLGGFSGSTNVTVGSDPYSVAIGDFNNDGKQDFAAANIISDTVSIRLGDGLGGFSGSTNVSVGTRPISVAIGDFNNDGNQDFAAGNLDSSTVSIRLGDGLGGFSGSTNVSVGLPSSIAIGDFNNDGKQDFAAALGFFTTVSIRLGGCNLAPTIAAVPVTRQAGSPTSNSTIATVNDAESGASGVTVTVTSANPSNGVTVSNIVNSGGTITANVIAACGATNASFTLTVTDGNGATTTATLNVMVNPNTPPTLTYSSPQTVAAGGGLTVNPATGPSDDGNISSIVLQDVGTYTGGIAVDPMTGVVMLTDAKPGGAHTITIRATDNCGATTDSSFTLNVACPTITVSPLSANLPNGFVGTAYSQAFTASGGNTPYMFTTPPGDLPGGLTLASGGALIGTPTTPGTFNFTVTATDSTGCTGGRSYTVIISGDGLMFYPLPNAVRLLDTRSGSGISGCTIGAGEQAANSTRTQPARTVCSTIPANATAVIGNITVVPSEPGFLTLFPSNAAQPTVANSNFTAGEITNNFFTVGLGATGPDAGAFKIFASAATHVIIDLTGYYAPPGAGGLFYHPLSSLVRLVETRAAFSGCFQPPQLQGTNDPNANPTLDLQVQGRSPGLPTACNSIPEDAVLLVGNATTVFPTAPDGVNEGYLTIYPSDAARPTVASSNYRNNVNGAVNGPFAVRLGVDGRFKVYTYSTTDLVVDITGYYSASAMDANGAGLLFTPLPAPMRLLETRPDFPSFPLTGCYRTNAPIPGGPAGIRTQPAWGPCSDQPPLSIPNAARALVGNVTAINTSAAGFLTLYPGDLASAPLVATSNYATPVASGYNRHYYVGLSPADGTLKMLTQFTTDLIVDVSGYFAP